MIESEHFSIHCKILQLMMMTLESEQEREREKSGSENLINYRIYILLPLRDAIVSSPFTIYLELCNKNIIYRWNRDFNLEFRDKSDEIY